MKLDNVKCPYCGGENTHAYQLENCNIWDDGFYSSMKNEYKGNLLRVYSGDNVIYNYTCESCEKHFSAIVEIDATVKNVITKENAVELMNLTVNSEVQE